MAEQLVMPIPATTQCGYCLRNLVLQPGGHWACPRCAPILSDLGRGKPYPALVAAFAEFQRVAWADREKSGRRAAARPARDTDGGEPT